MNSLYKLIAFLTISFGFAFLTMKLGSSFVNKFAENILTLLTTLFAINIASSTLIAGKIREIQDTSGVDFHNTKKNLKNSFYEQIILIAIAFIFSMLRESKYLKNAFSECTLILLCDTILFFSFIFYIDIIRDIGKSLFDLLDFDNKKKK
jgi:hypothetical protein